MGLFAQLWAAHPALQSPAVINPCSTNGVPNFENQCAIRLGVAIANGGVGLASYPGSFCWHGHGRTHTLRVEQMKLWLDSEEAWFLPNYAEKYYRDARGMQKTFHYFLGRQGIVAFLNFWGPGNSGDHIDLWDGTSIAHGDLNYFERSQELWFWEIP